MALVKAREVNHFLDQVLRSVPLDPDADIHKGAFVAVVGGLALPLTAGDQFIGLAYESAEEIGGNVMVYTNGDFELPLPGLAAVDLGKRVYAINDETLSLTSTSNSYIGVIVGISPNEQAIVRLDITSQAP